jgi:predicted porin
MKKSLVALAALAATSAFAQSSVTISGAVDVAYADKKVSSATGANLLSAKGVAEGQNTANRLNFAMVEDLGGGMKAGAQFETGLNITNVALFGSRAATAGSGVIGASGSGEIPLGAYSVNSQNRQSYVHVSGGFGEIRAGYQRTNLYDLATFSGHLVGQEQFGGSLHVFGNAAIGGTRSNAITYVSPTMSGVKATIQMGSGVDREQSDTDTAAGVNGYTSRKQSRTSLRLDYSNGPLNAGWVHTDYTQRLKAGTTTTVTDIYGAAGTAAANDEFKGKGDLIAANYTMGNLKLTWHNTKVKKDFQGLTDATADVTYKANVYGGIYTMGNTALFAMLGNGTVETAGSATKTNDLSTSQYGIRHSLSKRTVAYIMNGQVKDKAQTAADKAHKGTVTAIGLMHAF